MADAEPDRPVLPTRRSALIALLLLAPAPSIGVAAALLVAPGPAGQAVFTVGKLWLLLFPAAWYLAVEKGRPSWSPPRLGGLGTGALLGVAIAAVILGFYAVIGAGRIDPELLRRVAKAINLARPLAFLAGATYWSLVNSLVEEYVYRWFMLRQCEALLRPRLALVAAALLFTTHHVLALSAYLGPDFVILASIGVFVGGLVWGWCYQRYRSIWPGWISHVLADVAVFAVGWHLLFG